MLLGDLNTGGGLKFKHHGLRYDDDSVAYQCQTAGEYHGNDESLEVAVFDEFVHVTAAGPPDTSRHRGTHHVTAVTVSRTHCRTAIVRVLDEDHVHLHTTATTHLYSSTVLP